LTLLVNAVRAYPERDAIIHGSLRRSYRQFYERSVRLASALARLGIGRGDTVALLALNGPAVLEANYGVPMLGAVLNAINTRLDAEGIAFILDHGEAKLFIADRELGGLAKAALEIYGRDLPVIEIDDPLAESGEPIGGEDYEASLASGDPQFAWPGIGDEWQPIALNYTSGTTGDPKGVVYHHRGAYIAALSNALATRSTWNMVYLWTLPMFHCNGWTNVWVVTALAGTHVFLRRVDPARVFRLIDEHRVTHLSGAPIVLNMLVNAAPGVGRRTTHAIEFATGGAAPPAAVIERAAALNLRITHLYGLTESYGPATLCAWHEAWNELSPEQKAKKMARQGVPTPAAEMEVLDPNTMAPVPWDGATLGEIMIRGHGVMSGYFRNPSTTEAAFAGDWFHSGDLAVVHGDGYIEIKDRAKDIIISGGENISSLEIESVLYHHPAVLEAAVVARPDATWGEAPCAFVALKAGHETVAAEEIIAYCRAHMAHFKCPKTVVFGELPKTSTGKIQKFVLRERAQALAC